MRQKQPRIHSEAHLNFIRALPCVACMNNIQTEAAHVRGGDLRAAKEWCEGVGRKPHDRWTVPLCSACHRLQHEIGEPKFWAHVEVDPVFLALALHSVSGDHEAGETIIRAWQ